MNTPNGAKRMKKDGEQRSAEVTRNLFQGSSKKSKYPTNRNSPNTAEKGLPTTRTLFPYPPHLKIEWIQMNGVMTIVVKFVHCVVQYFHTINSVMVAQTAQKLTD